MPLFKNRNHSAPIFSKPRRSRRAILALIGGIGGLTLAGGAVKLMSAPAQARGKVTLYKNPQCECCEGYADYLRDNGFEVKVLPSHDLLVMGQNYGIPDADAPCHISVIGDYVVGGHRPIEVVNRLLSDKPKITGINLPGMPTGTPGMPGPKMQLTIYEIGQKPPKVYAVV